MGTKLTILGFSEATLTMIFDILDEKYDRPHIEVVNNLNLAPRNLYKNSRFNIEIVTELSDYEKVMIGAARTSTRKSIRDSFSEIPIDAFISIISETSYVSSNSHIGTSVIINPMCSIAGQTTISDFVFINRGVLIGHHTYVGEFTTINPGANIAGNVVIGKNCQIGMGALVLDGVTIGEGSIIGAGSIVTKDVPPGVIAYGNPCKVVRPCNSN
jgi:sugar O-acyltransferase (sialic acid O-acetyltransferase NeuD family)